MTTWTAFYWGDYLRDTQDLSLLEHGAYFRLLAGYYAARGAVLAENNRLYRLCGAQTDAEREAVDTVAARFFSVKGGYLVNTRADQEIQRAQAKSIAAQKANAARWGAPGGDDPDALRSESGRSPSGVRSESYPQPHKEPQKDLPQESPSTHTGDTTVGGAGGSEKKRAQTPKIERPEYLGADTWRDYLAHRKALKAPLTATAWSRIAGELEKAQAAGWDPNDALGEAMAAGWRGFRADWLENRTGGRGGSRDNGSGGTAFARLKRHVKAGHGLEQVRTDSPDLVPAVEQFGGMARLRGMRESEFEFLRAQFLSIYRQN